MSNFCSFRCSEILMSVFLAERMDERPKKTNCLCPLTPLQIALLFIFEIKIHYDVSKEFDEMIQILPKEPVSWYNINS